MRMKQLHAEEKAVWEEVELFKKRAASGYYSSDEEMIAAERQVQQKINEVHRKAYKIKSEKRKSPSSKDT